MKNNNYSLFRLQKTLTVAGFTVILIPLTGCVNTTGFIGEKLKNNQEAIPEKWFSVEHESPKSNLNSEKADNISWWKNFGDGFLNLLIDNAIDSAPDIKVAISRIRQARSNLAIIGGGYLPTISASLNTSRNANGKSDLLSAENTYRAGIDASWEVPIFNGQDENYNAATADYESEKLSLKNVRTSLISEISSQYVNLRQAQMRLQLTQNNIKSQEEALEIVNWKAQAGITSILDVEQAQANLAQSRASLPELELTQSTAINRLAVLLGISPMTFRQKYHQQLNSENFKMPQVPDNVAVDIPLRVLSNRPDVRIAELSLIAEENRAIAKKYERYPSLTLGGSLNWQALSISALGGTAGLVKSLFAKLAVSILDGNKTTQRTKIQEESAYQAQVKFEKTIILAIEEVENAIFGLRQNQEKLTQLQIAATKAESADTITRQQYEIGLSDFQKVLTANQNKLSAQNSYEIAKADGMLATIKLYKALGGDINYESNPSTTLDTKSNKPNNSRTK